MAKKQHPKPLTEALRQYHVVTAALHQLGGGSRAIDTEDVAVRSFELAPHLFCWQKYPKHINLELVRVALSDAKKPKNGGLTSGSGRTGWRLTQSGLAWAQQVSSFGKRAVSSSPNGGKRSAGSVDVVRRNREKARLEGSAAWQSWIEGHPVSQRDARSLFRIDQYTTDEMLEMKIVRLLGMPWNDSQIDLFLKHSADVLRQGVPN